MESSIYANMDAAMRDFFKAYEDVSQNKDVMQLSRTTTPDCSRHIYPVTFTESIGKPADWHMSNEEYHGFLALNLPKISNIRYKISETCIDITQRKGSARVVLNTTETSGEHAMEQVWFFDFTDDGAKMKVVGEFLDTVKAASNRKDMPE
ncbi:hypothetical protein F5B20DRAFT_531494 [Whalleya microplaca]|nr:hypothetical protein F5B20DRAFT_531494 [Whalleya microplaca]